jgi:hypothetical protein
VQVLPGFGEYGVRQWSGLPGKSPDVLNAGEKVLLQFSDHRLDNSLKFAR